MSIVPVSSLSRRDLRLLGNNVTANPSRPGVPRHHARHSQLAAINRSLAVVGVRVAALHRR